jgi:hypothetical protein
MALDLLMIVFLKMTWNISYQAIKLMAIHHKLFETKTTVTKKTKSTLMFSYQIIPQLWATVPLGHNQYCQMLSP